MKNAVAFCIGLVGLMMSSKAFFVTAQSPGGSVQESIIQGFGPDISPSHSFPIAPTHSFPMAPTHSFESTPKYTLNSTTLATATTSGSMPNSVSVSGHSATNTTVQSTVRVTVTVHQPRTSAPSGLGSISIPTVHSPVTSCTTTAAKNTTHAGNSATLQSHGTAPRNSAVMTSTVTTEVTVFLTETLPGTSTTVSLSPVSSNDGSVRTSAPGAGNQVTITQVPIWPTTTTASVCPVRETTVFVTVSVTVEAAPSSHQTSSTEVLSTSNTAPVPSTSHSAPAPSTVVVVVTGTSFTTITATDDGSTTTANSSTVISPRSTVTFTLPPPYTTTIYENVLVSAAEQDGDDGMAYGPAEPSTTAPALPSDSSSTVSITAETTQTSVVVQTSTPATTTSTSTSTSTTPLPTTTGAVCGINTWCGGSFNVTSAADGATFPAPPHTPTTSWTGLSSFTATYLAGLSSSSSLSSSFSTMTTATTATTATTTTSTAGHTATTTFAQVAGAVRRAEPADFWHASKAGPCLAMLAFVAAALCAF